MTLNQYAAKVTLIVDETLDPDHEYTDGFDPSVAASFLRRATPEQAAEEYMAALSPEDSR